MAFEFNIQTKAIQYKINLNSFPVAIGSTSSVTEIKQILDHWILPGYNQLRLEFNSDVPGAQDVKCRIIGELYETFELKGTEHKESIARFRWTPTQKKKLSTFQDQLEFAVDQAPFANFWSQVDTIDQLTNDDKEHLLLLMTDLVSDSKKPPLIETLYSMEHYRLDEEARMESLRLIKQKLQQEESLEQNFKLTLEHTRFISALEDKLIFLLNPFLDQIRGKTSMRPLLLPVGFVKMDDRWGLLVE